MKTFTKHILLLALMLFGVAGAAWASRAPQKFTGPVAITDLVQDDTLAPGFELTGISATDNLQFNGGRYSFNGTPQADHVGAAIGTANSVSYTDGNIILIYGQATFTLAPMVDMTTAGNAWVVTDAIHSTDGSEIHLSGISITPDPTVPALDELTGNWNFLMPGSNKVVKVTYKAEPALAWTFGDRAIPNDTTITAYRGFELPVIGSIGAIMNHDFYTALLGGTVSLRYGSTNPAVISFTNPNNMYSFSVNGAGECDVYMVFDGNDDFQDDSVAFHAVIANPATLTLAKEGNGTVSALLGGGSATWTTETWANLPTDQNLSPLTFGDITISTTGSMAINSSYNPGKLSFFVSQFDDAKTLTFSSEGGNFSRIEMTMISEYSQYNPSIIPADGWTFDGYTAVWEGDAPSVTVTSCSTYVSQITFTRGIDSIVATATEGQYLVIPGATVQVVATAVDGAHVSAWSGIDKAVTNLLSDTATFTVGETMTLTATFAQNPLLTLASNNSEWGTVTLDGVTPGATTYNITISENPYPDVTYTNVSFPFHTKVFIHAGLEYVDAVGQDPLSVYKAGDSDTAIIIIDEAYGGSRTIEYSYNNHEGAGHKAIFCDAVPGLPIMPEGVTYAGYDTYLVLPGTEVSVTATPDSAHYLKNFVGGADTNSNVAVNTTFTVTADTTLTANFQAKPTLTLAHNDGGTLEAIIGGGPVWGDGENNFAPTLPYTADGITLSTEGEAIIYGSGYSWSGTWRSKSSSDKFVFTNESGNFSRIEMTLSGNFPKEWGEGWTVNGDQAVWEGNANRVEIVNCTTYVTQITFSGSGAVTSNVTASTEPNTYYVDYNTDVTVVATPDATHYLVNFDNDADTNSNGPVEKTYTNITANDTATANFQAKPTLTLAANDGGTLTVEGAGSAGGEVTIGNGTETTSVTPYNSLWEYSFVESLYTAEEIGTAGTITSVSYHLRENDEPQTSDFVIYMKNVSRSTFASGTDYEPVTDADIVYSGSVTFNPGWTTITLGTPFEYDGTSNLMIAFDENIPGFITRYFYYTDNAGKVVSYHADNYNPDPYNLGSYAGNKTVSSNRANIKLDIAPAATAIVALSDTTYRVDYGTDVTVVATPDSAHYLKNFVGGADTNSNVAVNNTFVVTADTTLTANFAAKPTLTLAQTEGGTLEAIVPQGGAIVENVTADMVSNGWQGNYDTKVTEADLQAYGFMAVDEAAAAAWTGAPAFGDALLIYGFTTEGKVKLLEFHDGRNYGTTLAFYNRGFIYNIYNLVYFTTGTGTANVIASSTPNTYIIDYGTPVTVVATAVDGAHVSAWSPINKAVTNLLSDTATFTVDETMTLTATFAQNPVLTLASNDSEWGTVTLDGVTPGVTTYNITISDNPHPDVTYTNVTFPFQTKVFIHEGLEEVDVVEDPYPLNVYRDGDSAIIIIDEPYGGSKTIEYGYGAGEGGHKAIFCDAVPGLPIMPEGVTYAGYDTYLVLPGTEVSVTATPDSAHYLKNFVGGADTNSNVAVNTTFTVTADTTVTANFELKPTLTLAHNQGGEMEIVPEEVMAVNEFTVPSSWNNVESLVAATDLPSDFQSVKEAEARAWQNTTGHPVYLFYKAYSSGTVSYVRFNANGTVADISTGYKSVIYNYVSDVYEGYLVRYTTVGYASNFIASTAEPNTYYIDYGANVTVKATPSDTTYLVRFVGDAADTNSNVAVEKLYENITEDTTSRAYFNDKPVLTLAASDTTWGKVTIPIGLVATDPTPAPTPTAVANPVITGVLMPDGSMQVTMSCTTQNADIYYTTDNVTSPTCDCPAAPEYTHPITFTEPVTIKAAAYTGNDWSAVVTKTITLSLPAGVAQLTDSTYRVDYGTEVTVNAEATALHHVAGWQDEADNAYPAAAITYDNYAITEPANLFPALSTLTLTVTADTTTEVLFGINSYDVAATAQLDSRAEIGTGLAMGRIAAVYADIDGNTQFAGPDDTLTFTAQGGSSSSLIADTNYGYLFAGWYDANADTLMSDLPALILTEAYEVEARFVPDTFTVSYTQNIATAGTIEGADRYPYLTNMTLVATPATGYHFVNWKNEEGDILGTAAELPIQVLRDSAITAILDTNVYDVVANVNIEGLGTVTGAGEVKHFLSTTLVATANVKYHFVKWINAAGDSVSANTTIEVFPVGDTTLTAVFDTNIYATVWSGESDTTYTSLPYTGLTATYTDFWGNEHTPVLTFVCGSQTVVTPNYPVTAGTWTVTATPEVGDSLTSPVTTLTINRAIVNITGATVETAKFYDENTDAVVTNAGTLNNVQGSDAVTHTTTASYSDATVGDGKTITVNYTLHGTSALLANYTLTPASEVYTTNGDIIEPMEPRPDEEFEESDTTEVDNGFEVYAYGYCTGTSYRINYQLRYGYPDQYKLDFTDSRFTDVDWTNLPSAGRNGHIDIDVPVDLPTGDYTVTVTFRDSRYTWLESTPLTVTFHVNLPETYTRPLFKNVIALVDTCHCFTDIQWYYRADATQEWAAIPGATGYYYHANADQLDGQFFVKAKMNGVETFTCPQTDVETLITDEDGDISMDVFPNPTTDRVTVTVNGSQQTTHTLRILNTLGVELENGTFEGDITTIDFSRYQRGSYMVSVDGTVVRVIRN